jgi:hypothetical protein
MAFRWHSHVFNFLAGKSEPEVHLYDVWAQLPTSASSSFLAGERSRLPREQHMTF